MIPLTHHLDLCGTHGMGLKWGAATSSQYHFVATGGISLTCTLHHSNWQTYHLKAFDKLFPVKYADCLGCGYKRHSRHCCGIIGFGLFRRIVALHALLLPDFGRHHENRTVSTIPVICLVLRLGYVKGRKSRLFQGSRVLGWRRGREGGGGEVGRNGGRAHPEMESNHYNSPHNAYLLHS